MAEIKLPDLKKIEVIEYSLYAQQPTFSYDFVKGVNLIIGGNGLGKTTFINLIKYGLIGRYVERTTVKTYKEKKRERRKVDTYNYFSNRMNSNYANNEDAKVTLTFLIDNIEIAITRSLYELAVTEVKITENGNVHYLEGEIVPQRIFDNYIESEENLKVASLQYKFETFVIEHCNFSSFDDLIFFINNILLFDESRDMLLWDKDVQLPLLSKYFNPPELDAEIEDLKRQIKYYDSLSRHKSEDIRAINKLIKRRDSPQSSSSDNLLLKIDNLQKELNTINNKKLNSDANLEAERKSLHDIVSKKVRLENQISSIEEKISEIRDEIYKEIWDNLNPRYETFIKNITLNNSCPLCNNEITTPNLQQKIKNNHCLICDHELTTLVNDNINIDMKKYDDELNKLLIEKRDTEKLIIKSQKTLSQLESSINKFILSSLKIKNELHATELELQNLNTPTNDTDTSLNLIYEELKKLEVEKNEFIKKRDELTIILKDKQNSMENKVLLATKDVSSIFSSYATDFLGIHSKLIYDDNPEEREKMYVPFIGESPRYTYYSLSESQAFFIDQSFRFSIIDFFNLSRKYTSFYICETPDSSLDVSYEINAAKIFLNFANKPNTLIMTSNFNNSTFIKHIIKNSDIINYINLLNIGNVTYIQNSNSELNRISEEIEVMINEQKNKA